MANMNNKNKTKPIRVVKEFEEILNQAYAKQHSKYIKKGKRLDRTRITLAMANQYKKYPNLLKELEEANLQ